MKTSSLPFAILLVFVLAIFHSTCIFAQAGAKSPFLNSLRISQKEARKNANGKATITIVMRAGDFGRLFPTNLKNRVIAGYKILISDGTRYFLGTLLPCGQSTLHVNPPNLRIDGLEAIPSEGNSMRADRQPSLARVPILDKSIVLNPMTMDEGYNSTMAYMEFVNHFSLIPSANEPQAAEFAKVVYRFVDAKDQWTDVIDPKNGKKITSITAGLHLVSFNLLKYLKGLGSNGKEVLAIAKSGYNIQNLEDKIRNLVGKSSTDDLEKTFRSSDVKDEPTTPFRVKFVWVKKSAGEKEAPDSKSEPANLTLMKKLVLQAYSAPKKFHGKELYDNLIDGVDIHQLFRFMALNRLIENGDISDEYFWYVLKDSRSGKARLGVLPLDGDDMLKGVHMFPSSPKQIGLIFKGSAIGKKLGLETGYVINYEDPLFRIIREDPFLYFKYLEEFKKLAENAKKPGILDEIMGKITSKLKPYSSDHEVLNRGLDDERGREYSTDSFAEANAKIKKRFLENAVHALEKLNGSAGKPGDLQKAKIAARVN